jgi:hypothetical protein
MGFLRSSSAFWMSQVSISSDCGKRPGGRWTGCLHLVVKPPSSTAGRTEELRDANGSLPSVGDLLYTACSVQGRSSHVVGVPHTSLRC